MEMYQAIKTFNEQFSYEPIILNLDKFFRTKKFIIVGMGGSHLAGGLLKTWNPYLDIIIHKNYGLPTLSEDDLRARLVILSSYSGNTEEVLDAYDIARTKKFNLIAVSVGGELLNRAKRDGMPYIQLPETGIQPRSALGFSFKAFLKILGEEQALKDLFELRGDLKPAELEDEGISLAGYLRNHIPVVYASAANESIVYNWKIKFNETGKIPAFYNVFSELNHNEMTGFDVKETTRFLSTPFSFIFLKDSNDHPRIQKRMSVMEQLFRERGLPVKIYELQGKTKFHMIFSSLTLADWASFHTAQNYKVDPEQVPIIEEFKKLIQ